MLWLIVNSHDDWVISIAGLAKGIPDCHGLDRVICRSSYPISLKKKAIARLVEMGLAVGLLNELPLHFLARQCEVGSAALVCPCCPDDGADGVAVFDSGVEGVDDQDAEAFTSPIAVCTAVETVADAS